MADPMARESYRAVLRRFVSLLLVKNGFLLGGALAVNLILHHLAFNWISERLELYRDMRLVILALSIDFFLIALVFVSENVFRLHRDSGMFQELHLTGTRPDDVLAAFRRVVCLLIIGDTVIESAVGAMTSYELPEITLAGLVASCVFGVAAGWMYANLILLLNLLRRSVWLQLVLFCGLNFLTLLVFSEVSDRLGEHIIHWNRPESSKLNVVNMITRNRPVLWTNYSSQLSYFFIMLVESILFVVAGVAFAISSRKLRGQFSYWRR
jgi:hypothetical protein